MSTDTDVVLLSHSDEKTALWNEKINKKDEETQTITILNNVRVGAHFTYVKTVTNTINGDKSSFLGIVCLDDYMSQKKVYEQPLEDNLAWKLEGGINQDILYSVDKNDSGCTFRYRIIYGGRISKEYYNTYDNTIDSVGFYADSYILFIHKNQLRSVDIRTKQDFLLKDGIPETSQLVLAAECIMLWSPSLKKKTYLLPKPNVPYDNAYEEIKITEITIPMGEDEVKYISADMVLTQSSRADTLGAVSVKLYYSSGQIIYDKNINVEKTQVKNVKKCGLCRNLCFTLESLCGAGNIAVCMINGKVEEIYIGNRNHSNMVLISDTVYGFFSKLKNQLVPINVIHHKTSTNLLILKGILHNEDMYDLALYPSTYHPWVGINDIKEGLLSISHVSNIIQNPFKSSKLAVKNTTSMNLDKIIVPPMMYRYKSSFYMWLQDSPNIIHLYRYVDGIQPEVSLLSEVYMGSYLDNQKQRIADWKEGPLYNVLCSKSAAIILGKDNMSASFSVPPEDSFATESDDHYIADVKNANDTVWFIINSKTTTKEPNTIVFIIAWNAGTTVQYDMRPYKGINLHIYDSSTAADEGDECNRFAEDCKSCLILKTYTALESKYRWSRIILDKNQGTLFKQDFLEDEDDKDILYSTTNVNCDILYSTKHLLRSNRLVLCNAFNSVIKPLDMITTPELNAVLGSGITYLCMNSRYIWMVGGKHVTRIDYNSKTQETVRYQLPCVGGSITSDLWEVPTNHVFLESEFCPRENDVIFYNQNLVWLASTPQYSTNGPFRNGSLFYVVNNGHNSLIIVQNTLDRDSSIKNESSVDDDTTITGISTSIYELII